MRWFRRYTKSMQENPTKVQNKIRELNDSESEENKQWIQLAGFNALTTVSFGLNNVPTFNPSYGWPIKVFINNKTGEVKIFSANLFVGP